MAHHSWVFVCKETPIKKLVLSIKSFKIVTQSKSRNLEIVQFDKIKS